MWVEQTRCKMVEWGWGWGGRHSFSYIAVKSPFICHTQSFRTCLRSSHVTSSIWSCKLFLPPPTAHLFQQSSLFLCTFLSISTSICSYKRVLLTFPLILLSVESTRLPLRLLSIDSEFFTCFCFAKCFLFRNWHHRALQAKRYGSYFWFPSVC